MTNSRNLLNKTQLFRTSGNASNRTQWCSTYSELHNSVLTSCCSEYPWNKFFNLHLTSDCFWTRVSDISTQRQEIPLGSDLGQQILPTCSGVSGDLLNPPSQLIQNFPRSSGGNSQQVRGNSPEIQENVVKFGGNSLEAPSPSKFRGSLRKFRRTSFEIQRNFLGSEVSLEGQWFFAGSSGKFPWKSGELSRKLG